MTIAVKITRKGQVTIPKKIRDILKTNSVYFEIENNNIVLNEITEA